MITSGPSSPRLSTDFDRSPIPGLSSEISRSVVAILLSSPNAATNQALYQAWAVPVSPKSPLMLQAAKVLSSISEIDLNRDTQNKSDCMRQSCAASFPSSATTASGSPRESSSCTDCQGDCEGRAPEKGAGSTEDDSTVRCSSAVSKPWESEVAPSSTNRGMRRTVHNAGLFMQKPRVLDMSEASCSGQEEGGYHAPHPVCRSGVAGGRIGGPHDCCPAFRTYSPVGKPPRPPKKPSRSFSLGDVCGLAEVEKQMDAARKEVHLRRGYHDGVLSSGKAANQSKSHPASAAIISVLLGMLLVIMILFQGVCATEQSAIVAADVRHLSMQNGVFAPVLPGGESSSQLYKGVVNDGALLSARRMGLFGAMQTNGDVGRSSTASEAEALYFER